MAGFEGWDCWRNCVTREGQFGNKGGRSAHDPQRPRPRSVVVACALQPGEFFSLTVKLLEDSVDGTRAAAAAHGDVELVSVVLSHCECWFCDV